MSGVKSVYGPLLFLVYTSEHFSIPENKLIGYAGDYTVIAAVSSPSVRVTVAESLSRDLAMVSEWCDLWGMKFNPSKTKTIMVFRSRTILTVGGTVLKESVDLVIYWE